MSYNLISLELSFILGQLESMIKYGSSPENLESIYSRIKNLRDNINAGG